VSQSDGRTGHFSHPDSYVFLSRLFTRQQPGAVQRARLHLESLDQRNAPSSIRDDGTLLDLNVDDAYLTVVSLDDPSTDPLLSPPNQAPQITSFAAAETSPGQFRFSGTVVDESPTGMVVTLNGVQSEIQNYQTTVQSDGSFSCVIQLLTDGTDAGTVQAQTVDSAGLQSNVASVYVVPTVTP